MRLADFKAVPLCAALAVPAHSQTTWTWPGCPDVTDGDFSYTVLMRRGSAPYPALLEPVKMDFDQDAQGNVDLYFIERGGRTQNGQVKLYRGSSRTVTTLASIPTFRGPYGADASNIEEGLTGIALDPGFKANRHVYLHYSPATVSAFRVSRFTLSADGASLGSEKILLEFPAQRKYCCHTGGGMAFDAYGDLWITQGNNSNHEDSPPRGIDEIDSASSDEWGSSNTHNLRGSLLRIHPDNSARGYSIPAGNFGEYFRSQTGDARYGDTGKVLPQVYAKGLRNPYTLQLDPVRRWALIGEIGPNGSGTNIEEYNLLQRPAFLGWPYFVGRNQPFAGGKDPSAPTNTSKWNTGLTTLPAATPAVYAYATSSAITGPLYRYDGDLNSNVKLPPHFHRKWFVTDFMNSQVRVITLNEAGTAIQGTPQRIFANHVFHSPLDFKAGPDGALYVIHYSGPFFGSDNNTRIERIAYTGACRPPEPKLERPVSILDPGASFTSRPAGWLVHLGSGRPVRVPAGMTAFEIRDLMGRRVWEIRRLRPGEEFRLPSGLSRGAFKYRWIPAGS